MSEDETTIRELIDTWGVAASTWDLDTMLSLLDDDVVFLVVGAEPFGKKAFADRVKTMGDTRIESKNDIKEVVVFGDVAYTRNYLTVLMTKNDGTAAKESKGYVMSIFRRKANRRWVLARDANFLEF